MNQKHFESRRLQKKKTFTIVLFPISLRSEVKLITIMAKLDKLTVSKISSIQFIEFVTFKMRLFKIFLFKTLGFRIKRVVVAL